MNIEKKQENLLKRKYAIRKKLSGTDSAPRVSVYRSNKHIYAQAIDDVARKTLASAHDKSESKAPGVEVAQKVGESLAEKLKKLKINKVVFDRNGRKYHGRVKALAEALRSAGIQL